MVETPKSNLPRSRATHYLSSNNMWDHSLSVAVDVVKGTFVFFPCQRWRKMTIMPRQRWPNLWIDWIGSFWCQANQTEICENKEKSFWLVYGDMCVWRNANFQKSTSLVFSFSHNVGLIYFPLTGENYQVPSFLCFSFLRIAKGLAHFKRLDQGKKKYSTCEMCNHLHYFGIRRGGFRPLPINSCASEHRSPRLFSK